jgi:hypothetical protein
MKRENAPTRCSRGPGDDVTLGWNFERRRDTCTQFLIGVSILTKGLAERDTSLEAVRTRMRLSPEEALFAARRLSEENLIAFDPAGAVRSSARGIERTHELMAAVRSKAQRFDDVARTLRAGGPPLNVLAAVIRADGAPLACGGPDPDATYRLALVGDVVTLESQCADGSFAALPNEPD